MSWSPVALRQLQGRDHRRADEGSTRPLWLALLRPDSAEVRCRPDNPAGVDVREGSVQAPPARIAAPLTHQRNTWAGWERPRAKSLFRALLRCNTCAAWERSGASRRAILGELDPQTAQIVRIGQMQARIFGSSVSLSVVAVSTPLLARSVQGCHCVHLFGLASAAVRD